MGEFVGSKAGVTKGSHRSDKRISSSNGSKGTIRASSWSRMMVILMALIQSSLLMTQQPAAVMGQQPEQNGELNLEDGSPITLNSGHSNLKIAPFSWSSNELLAFSFLFSTRSYNGQLAYLFVTETSSMMTAFNIDITINRRNIQLQFLDGTRSNVLATLNRIPTDVSDGEEHSLAIVLNVDKGAISLKVDSTEQRETFKEDLTNLPKSELNILVGATGFGDLESVIGCASGFSFSAGEGGTIPLDAIEASDVSPGCRNRCDVDEYPDCQSPELTCQNQYSGFACNCWSVQKQGATCDQDLSVLQFDGDASVEYRFEESDAARQPSNIAFRFKGDVEDNQTALYGQMASLNGQEEPFHLIINGTAVTLAFGVLETAVEYPAFAPNQWRAIAMNLTYSPEKLTVSIEVLDSSSNRPIAVGMFETNLVFGHIMFQRNLYFGAAEEPATDQSYSGLKACVKQLLIGGHDVIGLVEKGDKAWTTVNGNVEFDCPNDEKDTGVVSMVQPEFIAAETEEIGEPEVGDDNYDYDTTPASPTSNTDYFDNEIYPDETNAVDDLSATLLPTVSTIPPSSPDLEEEPEKGEEADDKEGEEIVILSCNGLNCGPNGFCDDSGLPVCRCLTGFSGSMCQFSDLSRSCAELSLLGVSGEGVVLIDVDLAEGSIPPSHVTCGPGGETLIHHNFPNATQIRAGQSVKNSIFPLTYRFMDESALESLMDSSANCSQMVQYSCVHAPLNFPVDTWFTSVKIQEPFGQIGSEENACECNGTPEGCNGVVGGDRCNCDANQNLELSDVGYLRGEEAGLTSVTALYVRSQDWGLMSIGPLECTGTQSSESTSVTFKTSSSHLEIAERFDDSVEFWFLASQATNSIILQQTSASNKFFHVTLVSSHIVEFHFNLDPEMSEFYDETMTDQSIQIVSEGSLTNNKWHRIRINQKDGEIRVSVDTSNKYYRLLSSEEWSWGDKPLTIGGIPDPINPPDEPTSMNGFIGCVRGVTINGRLVKIGDLATSLVFLDQDQSLILMNMGSVVAGARTKCAHANPCQNGAVCLDNFEIDSYRCECANPWAHSGPHCDDNINEDSEVSVRNRNSYIRIRDMDTNPILSDITLSFKTDQSSGLLYYALDQFFNFIEVALHDDNRVTLTFNNNMTLHSCSIHSKQKLTNVEWQQMKVTGFEDKTELFVSGSVCSVPKPRLLSSVYVADWLEGQGLEDILPPRQLNPPDNSESIKKFTMVFLNGLPKPTIARGGGTRRRVKRRSLFNSVIPNSVGCLRGLKIADRIVNLRTEGQRTGTVYDECRTGCEQVDCLNGGHCKVSWEFSESATCDCSTSSYYGQQCNQDIGLSFDGSNGLEVNTFDLLNSQYIPPTQLPPTLSFAFSTKAAETATLLSMAFPNEVVLNLILEESGRLTVSRRAPGISDASVQFPGNHGAGLRHSVFLKFRPSTLYIKIDGMENEMDVSETRLRLTEVIQMSVGSPQIGRDALAALTYRGCLSNLVLDFRTRSGKNVYRPLEDYLNGLRKELIYATDEEFSIPSATCSQEAAPPEISEISTFPPFNDPFQAMPYVFSTVAPEEDGQSGMVIVIVLVVLLLLVLIGVGGYIYYVKCMRKPKDSTDANQSATYVEAKKTIDTPPTSMMRPSDNGTTEEREPLGSPPTPPHPADPNIDPIINIPPAGGGVENLPVNVELPDGTANLDQPGSPVYLNTSATSSTDMNNIAADNRNSTLTFRNGSSPNGQQQQQSNDNQQQSPTSVSPLPQRVSSLNRRPSGKKSVKYDTPKI